MRLALKYFTVLAIALARAADPSYVEAGTIPNNTFPRSQQSPRHTAPHAAYDSSFVCDMRSVERFYVRGRHSKYALTNLPSSSRFEAEHATFELYMGRRKAAAVLLDGGMNICWIGGRILSTQTRHSHKASYRSNLVAMQIQNLWPYANIALRDLHIVGGSNGLLINGNIDTIVWERGEIRELNESCILIDTFTLAVVRESLFDGCIGLIEIRDNSTRKAIVLDDNIISIVMRDDDDVVESESIRLFGESTDASIVLRNNVILLEGYIENALDYLYINVLANVTDCENNVFIFPGMENPREMKLDCGFITHDRTIWQKAKTEWLDLYSDEDLSVGSGTAAEDGTWNLGVADGAGSGLLAHVSDAIELGNLVTGLQTEVAEARDVVSESRESVRGAIAAAERAARAADLFLNRWSDDTFWRDGTGWLE